MNEYGIRSLWASVCLKACDDYINAYNNNDEKTLLECVEFFKTPIFVKITGVYAPEAVRKLQKIPPGTITHVWKKTREKRKYRSKKVMREYKDRPRPYASAKSWRTNPDDGYYAAKTISQKTQRLL